MMTRVTATHPDHWFDAIRVGRWRKWVALLTLGCVLSLFFTAASHHHDSDAEDRDCAVCSAVIHHVADSTPILPVVLSFFVALYFVVRAPLQSASFVAFALSPPICGPPQIL
jgi:hypothetical protein